MKTMLNDTEHLRLEKLVWLYCLEAGDENSFTSGSNGMPTAEELRGVLLLQDVDVDPDYLADILASKAAISDELATSIEAGFGMATGWLSQK